MIDVKIVCTHGYYCQNRVTYLQLLCSANLLSLSQRHNVYVAAVRLK